MSSNSYANRIDIGGGGGGGGSVSDTAYGVSWDGVTDVAPSKNAVYDKIETISAGSGDITDVGDCATGACFTGTSGNTLTFKGATSGTTTLKPTAVAGTTAITLPASTGTVLLNEQIDTYTELNTIVADVTLTHNGLIDTFAELDAIVADKDLANTVKAQIHFDIDGGGSVITTGAKAWIRVPFDMTITGWDITADQSGSIVIDVWKDTYTNFPPTVADTIAGTEKPTLATAQKNQDTSLTTWTTAVTAGDYIRINVDSVTTVTKVSIDIYGTKS